MTDEEAIVAVIDALETLSIPYMVVGSISSNFYGSGRSTKDEEFVIQHSTESRSRVAAQLGAAFRVSPETIFEGTAKIRRHALDVVGTAFQISLFHLSDDPHDQERFRRRKRVKLLGRDTNLPTVEDVIITKLRWALNAGRSKDREDVRDVIAVQGQNIDWPYVHGWCDQHGTRTLLDEIRGSLPPL